jgi:hypothetical protein
MYFGMLFTFFAWHTEDNDLYSINYMHSGAAKTWYAVPDNAAEDFEDVLKKTYPTFATRMPALQFRKCLMLSPHELKAAGVPTYRAVQHANQIAITFPRAFMPASAMASTALSQQTSLCRCAYPQPRLCTQTIGNAKSRTHTHTLD